MTPDYDLLTHMMENAPLIKTGEAFPDGVCTNFIIAYGQQMFLNSNGQAFKVEEPKDFARRYKACYPDQKPDNWGICYTLHGHGGELHETYHEGFDLPGAATQEIAQLLMKPDKNWIGELFYGFATVHDKAIIQRDMSKLRGAARPPLKATA